jgi:hypothetical protein
MWPGARCCERERERFPEHNREPPQRVYVVRDDFFYCIKDYVEEHYLCWHT